MTPPNKNHQPLNNLESENQVTPENLPFHQASKRPVPGEGNSGFASPDKYLALEQQGVSFTPDADPMGRNPDLIEYRQHGQLSDEWDANNRNSRNAEAFNQDEYILRDNIDLDQDQSRSVSDDSEENDV